MLGMGHDERADTHEGAALAAKRAALGLAPEADAHGEPRAPEPAAAAVPGDAAPAAETAAGESAHGENASDADAPAEAQADAPAAVEADAAALLREQMKHVAGVLRSLKRHSQAGPFLQPVDPIALGIPEYPNVVKHPMDLSTVARKLDAGEYATPGAFEADVRLMLSNCFAFNHPDSVVAKMGRGLEKYFDGAMARMPTTLPAPKAAAQPVADARARREPKAPRRLSAASASSSAAAARRPSGADMAHCGTVLRELFKKTHFEYAFPFLEPVDPVALGIPDYFDVIKAPMDLGTVRRKYEAGRYADAAAFEADVRLVFANCYAYNAPDSDVVALCRRLEAVFDEKWASRGGSRAGASPRPRVPPSYNQGAIDALEDDSEKILEINRQIQGLQKQLSDLLERRAAAGGDASRAPAARRASAPPKARPAPRVVTEAEFLARPMSFEEKRQLSADVNGLSPERLGRVVEIIQAGMDLEAEGESDTIELDIEALDVATLRRLQRYVMECQGVTSLAEILGESAAKRKKTAPRPQAPVSPAAPADDLSSDDDDL